MANAFDSSSKAATAKIRMSSLPFDGTALAYYAKEVGFFDRASLNVDIQTMVSGAAILAAVAGGSLDIGAADLIALSYAHTKGLPFTIISPGGLYTSKAPTDALLVPLASNVQKASDLNGKTIAVNALKNITQFGFQTWMDKNGGQSSTNKFIEMPSSGLAGAFEGGRIDAAITAEPFMALLKTTTRTLAYAMDAIAPSFTIAAYFTTTDWAKSHPEEVRNFQDAMRNAAIWANNNHDKSAEILATISHIDIGVVRSMTRIPYPERLAPSMIQPVIDVTVKYGGGADFAATDLLYHP